MGTEWYCPVCGPINDTNAWGECPMCLDDATREIPAFFTALNDRLAALEKVAEAIAAYYTCYPTHMIDGGHVPVVKALREAGYLKEEG